VVQLTVSEPVNVTLEILSRKGKTLGEVTLDQVGAGSFDARISLWKLFPPMSAAWTRRHRPGQ
jgi:hypothetical protein